MLALAQAALDRGHEVVVLSQPSLRERAEALGCRFVTFSGVPDYERGTAIEEQLAVTVPMLAGAAVGDDLLAVARASAVDLVVVDANLGGGLAAAETLAQPSAVLLHSMYATFVDLWFADLWPLLGGSINEVRAHHGLGPVDGWAGMFAPHERILSVVPAAFEAPIADPPAALRHAGFLLPRPAAGDTAPGFPPGADPTVLVGLSTTYQHQERLLGSIIDALGDLPVRGLVTTARQVEVGRLRAPPNVLVEDFVAHSLVLPQTDVVVTHAGMGTVAAALSFGVPLVCTPMGRDQPLNAGRVVALGAGLALAAEATPEALARAVEEVLAQPSYRRAAESLARASRDGGGAAAAVEDLESLLA
jgi:UDP:flavonoid glycosyltransferase YjiC (YdhE family)